MSLLVFETKFTAFAVNTGFARLQWQPRASLGEHKAHARCAIWKTRNKIFVINGLRV
jgi:hypothetical protein